VSVLTPLIEIIATVISWLVDKLAVAIEWVAGIIEGAVNGIASVFEWLYNLLVGNSIIPDLIQGIRDWFQRGVDWVKGIIAWFAELPVLFGQWLGGVREKVAEVWTRIREVISDHINQTKEIISRVLGAISDKWNEIWGGVTNFVSTAWNNIGRAIGDGINGVLGWFRDLPSRIVGALGSLGNLLGGVGHDLIIGFWNGLVGMWDWLRTSIYNFFSGIMPQWVKDALGIASPSKVFAKLGRELPAGMALGITQASGLVESAIAGLATAATVGVGGMMATPAYAGASPGAPRAGGGNVYQITVNVPVTANSADVGAAVVGVIEEYERRSGSGWRA
jgi:phage-related protein